MTEQPTPAAAAGKSVSSAILGLAIVRACEQCRAQGVASPRTPGQPCAVCGNSDPPETTNLGTVAAGHRNPLKQRWWDLIGHRLADRRIAKAAARTLALRTDPHPQGSDHG